ncbi:MAG: hypothetical protein ACRC6H_05110, partial [Culicoidibacterales bacterium]
KHFGNYLLQLRKLAKQHHTIVIYCSRARFRSKFVYFMMRCFKRNTYILSGGIKGIHHTKYEALCPTCGAEHSFNDFEIQNTAGMIHCKKCAQLIPIYPIR